MVILKLIRNSAGGTEYIDHLSNYIKTSRRTGEIRPDFVTAFGYGVDFYDTDQVYTQMVQVQKYFGKEYFNPLLHFVVCYGKEVKTEDEALRLSCKIAEFYQYQFQVFGGIHCKKNNESKYHLHLMVNAVSYVNGAMVNSWIPYLEEFRKYVSLVTGQPVQLKIGNMKEDI